MYHGVALTPYIQSIDTLKEAKKLFLFNSNKLDLADQSIQKFPWFGDKVKNKVIVTNKITA